MSRSNIRRTAKKGGNKNTRKRGGCGCDKTAPVGVGLPLKGGGTPFFSYPTADRMIPLNSFKNDMTDPANQISARQLPNFKMGGKKGKKRGKGKKSKKMKGGDFTQSLSKLYDFALGRPTDPISSFGTTAGAVAGAKLASANSNATQSFSTTDQPTARLFSSTNPPKI